MSDDKEEIKAIQTLLKDFNLYKGTIDGIFGKNTKKAVEMFQKYYDPNKVQRHHEYTVPLVVDGVVGRNTILAMDEADVNDWRYNLECKLTVELIEKITAKTNDWFNHSNMKNHGETYKVNKELFVKTLNEKLEKYNINSCLQKAHFLAQIFHETDHFNTLEEYASGWDYDLSTHINGYESFSNGNKSVENKKHYDRYKECVANDNMSIGDGPKYKGKGLIQLTWKINYKKYSEASGNNVVDTPNLLSSNIDIAIDTACWYWRNNGTIKRKYSANGDINVLIDNEKYNVELITKAVNGGTNGLEGRQSIFEKLRHEWGL